MSYFTRLCVRCFSFLALALFVLPVSAAVKGDIFRRVVSKDDLKDGDEIIFVCSDGESKAMGKTRNGNAFNSVSVNTSNGTYSYSDSDGVLVARLDRNADGVTFELVVKAGGDKYLSYQSSTSNNISDFYVGDRKANWTISLDNGKCTLRNGNMPKGRRMMFYGQLIRFYEATVAAYALPYIYKKQVTTAPVAASESAALKDGVSGGVRYLRTGQFRLFLGTGGSLPSIVGDAETVGFNVGNTLSVGSDNIIYKVCLDFADGMAPSADVRPVSVSVGTYDYESQEWLVGANAGELTFGADGIQAAQLHVQYGEKRTLASVGDYGTICLPFDVAASDMAGAYFYETDYRVVEDETTKEVRFAMVNSLQAGKPYLFQCDGQEVLLGYSGTERQTAGEGSNGFYGVLTTYPFSRVPNFVFGDYYIVSQNQLRKAKQTSGANAGRAYLRLSQIATESTHPAPARVLRMDVDRAEADGLAGIAGEEGSASAVYDMQGRRVAADAGLRPGIYIKGGRKYYLYK